MICRRLHPNFNNSFPLIYVSQYQTCPKLSKIFSTLKKMTWFDLKVPPIELRLDKTLPTGQCFRWVIATNIGIKILTQIQTNPNEWTMVLNKQLITLKQTPESILFKADDEELARQTLADYFQLDICLKDLMEQWCKDKQFKKKQIEGLRMMKQPKIENIFSFICSSNNNISRITSLVNKLNKYMAINKVW